MDIESMTTDQIVAHLEARKSQPAGLPVLVTTEHRGVFFGYCDDVEAENITLDRARMCIYWSAAMRGVLGLATIGPDDDCKIQSAPTKRVTLRGVTAVAEVEPTAVARWERAPWAS